MNDIDTLRPEVRTLSNDLLACADEVAEFPHPSHCDHLHDAAALMRDASAELLRLTDENARLLAANRDCVDHFEQMQAELAALKARMKPCAQVVGGEVRVFMDSGDEGKYVAVMVVEE